jgi:hypothetical protein
MIRYSFQLHLKHMICSSFQLLCLYWIRQRSVTTEYTHRRQKKVGEARELNNGSLWASRPHPRELRRRPGWDWLIGDGGSSSSRTLRTRSWAPVFSLSARWFWSPWPPPHAAAASCCSWVTSSSLPVDASMDELSRRVLGHRQNWCCGPWGPRLWRTSELTSMEMVVALCWMAFRRQL